MTTGSRRSEKQGNQNEPAAAKPKFGRAGTIAGAVLVGGILLTNPNPFKFINNNQSNVSAAYGDNMAKYQEPKAKPYGKSIISAEEQVKKWEKDVLNIYKEQSEFLNMENKMRNALKEHVKTESVAENFTAFLQGLTKDQRKLFLTITSALIEDPKALSAFVNATIMVDKRMKWGEKIPLDLDEKIKTDIQAGAGTADAYNSIMGEIGQDELSQHMFQMYLTAEKAKGRLEPATLFLDKYYVKKPLENDVLDKVATSAPSILKSAENFMQKTVLEMFDELMDPKLKMLNERERVLFLNILTRLDDVQRKYALGFITGVYAAAQDKGAIGNVYMSEMERLKDMWGFEFQEMLESVFERAEPGRNYTTLEKIMVTTLYHYSYMEAFQVNPPAEKSFFSQLLEHMVRSGTAATASSEKQSIEGQKYYAMGVGLSMYNTSQTDALVYSSALLFTPLLYGASASITAGLSFTAQAFVEWIVSKIDPAEVDLVTKFVFRSMGGKAKVSFVNDLYSLMEFGANIGYLGDKYRDIKKREDIDKALENIKKGITKGIVKWEKHPLMVTELHRLMNICVVATGQQPGKKWYKLYDLVLGETLIAIEDGVIKTEADMVDYTNVMDYISRTRRYNLGKVAEAIRKAVDKGHPLSEVLKNAVELAKDYKKIDKKALKNPKKAKPLFGLTTVPKKESYYAKTIPKKSGSEYA